MTSNIDSISSNKNLDQDFDQNIDNNTDHTLENTDFKAIDLEILDYWQKHKIFQKSIENRKNAKDFVIYDGPPFANGLPHYGHLLTGYMKDVFGRYFTMKGYRVERRFGWDCHGLPAEMQTEKELKIMGKNEIQKFGVAKFNEHCEKSVMKYVNEWRTYVTRQGRWVDFENSYKTMDINFMESVLWGFKELYKQGYIYESLKIVPYSYSCETPLSHFETRLDNSYREILSKAITCKFELEKNSINQFLIKYPALNEINLEKIHILIWTTTPWTLPSNLAVAVNENLTYVLIKKDNVGYILAKNLIHKFENLIGEEILIEFTGKELLNLRYLPLFNYFDDLKNTNKAVFTILHGNFVSSEDGTGIVHLAPGFGEEDFNLCVQNNIPIVCPIDNSGKFTAQVKNYEGKLVFDTIDEIIIQLKKQNNWLKTEQYRHNYPHCWRTDTPLIYRAISSWYVKVTNFKDKMVELNQNVNWIPEYIKNNLFGKWLDGAKDWAISRNRFWGTPIPIWKSNDPKYPRIEVYGSIDEIEKAFDVKITNLHKEYLDALTKPNPDDPTGKSCMVRCEDVFDCWFESGSMPFAQKHYPFENKTWFEENFPADLIIEYTAQTRGWFYTLFVLSTALFGKIPFKNCIAHGVILDIQGQKLSKRLNNYENPLDIFDKSGSDAVRLTMLKSGVTKGSELKLDSKGEMISESIKKIIKPFYNAAHFLLLYQQADNIPLKISFNSQNALDQYILLKLKHTIEKVEENLNNFITVESVEFIEKFLEILTNWFIRRSRIRFWSKGQDEDKISAYNTLYTCLIYLCRMSAPLMPFTTEKIYLNLIKNFQVESKNTVESDSAQNIESSNAKNSDDTKNSDFNDLSVHLCNCTRASEIKINLSEINAKEILDNMDLCIQICSNVFYLRNKFNLKIRQPLNKLTIGFINQDQLLDNYLEIIKNEVNIKNIEIIDNIEEIAERKISLNFQLIGKRIPNDVKNLIKLHKNKEDIYYDQTNNALKIGQIDLLQSEYEIEFLAKNQFSKVDKNFILILDTNVTAELKLEGIARDLIRSIQNIRKNLKLNITHEINQVIIVGVGDILNSIEQFDQYIRTQCLIKNLISHNVADNIQLSDEQLKSFIEEIDSEKITIYINL